MNINEQKDKSLRPVYNQTGLYVHVPFCNEKCSYCDFYSLSGEQEMIDEYVAAVIRAIETHTFDIKSMDTIYFGGGTPSVLTAAQLGKIFDTITKNFTVASYAEITMEANPESAKIGKLRDYKKIGFNRISFGVQSSNDRELVSLGRLHNAKTAREAILNARLAGFGNISADLMLGIPYQTNESLEESVEFLTSMPINHISAYMLSLEENVPLYSSRDRDFCADDDQLSDFYLKTTKLLKYKGFVQYEISNFCKEGKISHHNSKYWEGVEYLGIGPSAHSYVGRNRFDFPSDLNRFILAPKPFELINSQGTGGDLEESLMLGLRLSRGIDIDNYKERYKEWNWQSFLDIAARLQKNGLVNIEGNSVLLTERGFLLSNQVIFELLGN